MSGAYACFATIESRTKFYVVFTLLPSDVKKNPCQLVSDLMSSLLVKH
jgi:hypothetical protein